MCRKYICRPGECFYQKSKKRDLPAKSGTVGRAQLRFFQKYTTYRNELRSKIHCSTAIRPRYRLVFLREIERNFRNYVQLGDLH